MRIPTTRIRVASAVMLKAAILVLIGTCISGCNMRSISSDDAIHRALEEQSQAHTPNVSKTHTRSDHDSRSPTKAAVQPRSIEARSSPAALPKRTLRQPQREVRGIYVSSYAALTPSRMEELADLVDRTELNAIVLDINSGARLLGFSRAADGAFLPSKTRGAQQLRETVRRLKKRNVYMIARIVTFKDNDLARAIPAWALKRKDGSVFRDAHGLAWIDPYREAAWSYPIALAAEAAKAGFDEVQYDYVRFPENASKVDAIAAYANPSGRSKSETIRRFMRQATADAHARGLPVSVDVFGMVTSSMRDLGIGQKWKELAAEADVMSPMVYPSHYANGTWGIRYPDLTPGAVIARALKDASKQNASLQGAGVRPAQVRPWLQGFTAGWVHPHQRYGAVQIREQIRAARGAGYRSYLIWNASSKYPVFQA